MDKNKLIQDIKISIKRIDTALTHLQALENLNDDNIDSQQRNSAAFKQLCVVKNLLEYDLQCLEQSNENNFIK